MSARSQATVSLADAVPAAAPITIAIDALAASYTPPFLTEWLAHVAAAREEGYHYSERTFTITAEGNATRLGAVTVLALTAEGGSQDAELMALGEGRLAELAAYCWTGYTERLEVAFPGYRHNPSAAIRATAPSGAYVIVSGENVTIRTPRRRRRGQSPSDDITVMSDPHTQAAIRGMYAASNGHSEIWQQRGSDAPVYQDKNGVMVYTRTADGGQLNRPDDIGSAWRQILAFDDHHVNTFLICLGKWFAETGGDDGPGLESARVTVDDVLSFRGVTKHHKGGYKAEQKREARDAMLALNNLWVRFTDRVHDRRGKRGQLKTVYVDSRLLEVAYESDTDLFGQELPYAFRVRPGEWAAPYLGEANRRTALLLRPIMQNDLRSATGRFAMRIGIYLTMQWRIRASRNNYAQPWEVRTLLDGACIPIETDARLYARFREYVEGALDKLEADGVLRWQYVDTDDDQLPARGWFPAWLRWRVQVEPADAITERYQQLPARRARGVAAAKAAARRAATPTP